MSGAHTPPGSAILGFLAPGGRDRGLGGRAASSLCHPSQAAREGGALRSPSPPDPGAGPGGHHPSSGKPWGCSQGRRKHVRWWRGASRDEGGRGAGESGPFPEFVELVKSVRGQDGPARDLPGRSPLRNQDPLLPSGVGVKATERQGPAGDPAGCIVGVGVTGTFYELFLRSPGLLPCSRPTPTYT